MTLVLLLSAIGALLLPALACSLGRRLPPAEWARLCVVLLAVGAAAVEVALMVIGLTSVLDLAGVGRHVTRAELQPGDLIFRYRPISHVAMYVGNGMQVAATHTGSTVKLQSAFQGEIVGYSRPTG
jgi:hypothetical protein